MALLVAAGCERQRPAEPDLKLRELPWPSALCPRPIAADLAAELPVGESPPLRLSPREMALFTLSLHEGEFFAVQAEQSEVDLVLCLYDSRGNLLLPVDRPTGKEDPEELAALAPEAGRFLLGVKAFAAAGEGSYRIALEREPQPGEKPRWQAEAAIATALAESWQWRGEKEAVAQAGRLFELALTRQRLLGDAAAEGDVLYRLGYLRRKIQHDPTSALAPLEGALPLVNAYGGPIAQAQTHAELGQALLALGRAEESLEHLERAGELYRQLGRRSSHAAMVNEQATARQLLGQFQEALDGYERAVSIFRALGEKAHEATVLHNRGVLASTLGRDREAEDDLRAALRLWQEARPTSEVSEGSVKTLTALGSVELGRGRTEAALVYFERSLPLRRELGDAIGESVTLGYLGLVEQRLGRLNEALAHHRAAVARVADLPSPCARARALMRLAGALGESDELQGAADSSNQARRAAKVCGDPFLESAVLYRSARIKHQGGDHFGALEEIRAAISLVDRLREAPESSQLRSTFFATKQDYYDFGVDLLMGLSEREPDAGYDRQALELAERGLARSLLDLIQQGGSSLRRNVPAPLAARKRHILDALNRHHRELALTAPFGIEAEAANNERMRALVRELDFIETAIRRASPEPSTLATVEPVSLERIEREILDAGTLVLYYKLGRSQSYLWALGTDGLESFLLPGRDQLEPLVRRAHGLLASRDEAVVGVKLELTLRRLSELLLQPVQHRLSSKRLVIVANGTLQLLPFAALPSPSGKEGLPLVVSNEIVVEPSLSVLSALVRTPRVRAPASHRVAVFADPVFSIDDPRVRRPFLAPSNQATRQGPEPESYERLTASRREAEQIAALLPASDVMLHLDFAASRRSLESDRLDEYQSLHFATHGAIDQEHPGLSHLVLSLVDESGRPQDGKLYAYEIHQFDLAADLVVLSSCDSGLGKEIAGEGLVGLPHAFFDAGARRVIVSLWRVGDESTSALMARFYRHYLVAGLPPAAALRKAQIEEREVSPWPRSWAAFVVQGPWR